MQLVATELRPGNVIIHNGQLDPPPLAVRRSLPSIAARVIDATSRTAVTGDLFRI